MRRVLICLAALLGLVTVGLATAPGSVAGASGSSVVVVNASDLVTFPTAPTTGQFVAVDQSGGSGGGQVSLVAAGPDTNQGSLQMTTTGTASHWSVYNEDQAGTALSDITSLSYSTETNDSGATLDPSLQLVIDPGNTSSGPDQGVTFSTVNFEPYEQSTPIVPNAFQSWEVTAGVVWGTHLTGAPISAPISWSTFVSDYPNATILGASSGGGVGFNVGSGWTAVTDQVGSFTFGTSAGTTTYAFDPSSSTATAPTTSSFVLGGSNTDVATVTGNTVVGAPTGTVSFYQCGPTTMPTPCASRTHPVGTAQTLTPGSGHTSTVASGSFTPTSGGYWCFAGVYSGDSNYPGSSDATTDECFHVLPEGSSTTTLPISTTIVYGSTNNDSVTVSGNAAGGSPTGAVDFSVCGPLLVPTACTGDAGPVAVSRDQLVAGPNNTATTNSVGFTPTTTGYWCFAGNYSGSASYTASSDATLDECFNVTLAPTSTTSAPTNATITLGMTATDAVTVTNKAATGAAPDGTVSFYECGPTSTAVPCTSTAHPVGTRNLTVGTGSTSKVTSPAFKPTAVGFWCFGSRYTGDANFSPSSDTKAGECVNVKGPLTMITTTLPSGTKGKAYNTTLVARGGTTPYKWAHTGALPKGMALTAGGRLDGTPTTSGSFTITFKVSDSSKPREFASRTIKLVIAP